MNFVRYLEESRIVNVFRDLKMMFWVHPDEVLHFNKKNMQTAAFLETEATKTLA